MLRILIYIKVYCWSFLLVYCYPNIYKLWDKLKTFKYAVISSVIFLIFDTVDAEDPVVLEPYSVARSIYGQYLIYASKTGTQNYAEAILSFSELGIIPIISILVSIFLCYRYKQKEILYTYLGFFIIFLVPLVTKNQPPRNLFLPLISVSCIMVAFFFNYIFESYPRPVNLLVSFLVVGSAAFGTIKGISLELNKKQSKTLSSHGQNLLQIKKRFLFQEIFSSPRNI